MQRRDEGLSVNKEVYVPRQFRKLTLKKFESKPKPSTPNPPTTSMARERKAPPDSASEVLAKDTEEVIELQDSQEAVEVPETEPVARQISQRLSQLVISESSDSLHLVERVKAEGLDQISSQQTNTTRTDHTDSVDFLALLAEEFVDPDKAEKARRCPKRDQREVSVDVSSLASTVSNLDGDDLAEILEDSAASLEPLKTVISLPNETSHNETIPIIELSSSDEGGTQTGSQQSRDYGDISDSAFSAVVSDLAGTASTNKDEFFDQPPELCTPEKNQNLANFHPLQRFDDSLASSKVSLQRFVMTPGKSSVRDFVPETESEDDEGPLLVQRTPERSRRTPRNSTPALRPSNPTPEASNPTPGVSNPAPGASNPTPGASNPTPGVSNPTPATSNPVPRQSNPPPRSCQKTPKRTPIRRPKSTSSSSQASSPEIALKMHVKIDLSVKLRGPIADSTDSEDEESTEEDQSGGRGLHKHRGKEKEAAEGPLEGASTPEPRRFINTEEEKLLQSIYGNAWRTPSMLKKMRENSGAKPAREQVHISSLESTSMSARRSPEKAPSSPEKPETPPRRRQTRPRALQICDSEDSESDAVSSDESWKASSLTDDTDTSIPASRPKRNATTRPRAPTYLDSSSEEAERWTDLSPRSPQKPPVLANILDSCEYKPRSKLPPTPQVQKRRLFNQQSYEESRQSDQENEDKQKKYDRRKSRMDQDIEGIREDELTVQVPDFLLAPINKKLERVKEVEKKDGRKESGQKRENRKEQGTLSFLQSLDVAVSLDSCDPMALMYRQCYKQKKNELAEKLFQIYNDAIFKSKLEAPISWNKKLLNTAGRCCLSRKNGVRLARIELSEKVLTSADRLRCTLIHEMCHAATWIFDGEDGHGRTWKAWASKSNKTFPELPKINTCHNYAIEFKYTYVCTLCKASSHAHSRSKKVENIQCKFCKGPIQILLNRKDKEGNVVSTPARKATGFAKFVKEQYRQVKRPSLKHAEVMRILGENFGGLSVEEKARYN